MLRIRSRSGVGVVSFEAKDQSDDFRHTGLSAVSGKGKTFLSSSISFGRPNTAALIVGRAFDAHHETDFAIGREIRLGSKTQICLQPTRIKSRGTLGQWH